MIEGIGSAAGRIAGWRLLRRQRRLQLAGVEEHLVPAAGVAPAAVRQFIGSGRPRHLLAGMCKAAARLCADTFLFDMPPCHRHHKKLLLQSRDVSDCT